MNKTHEQRQSDRRAADRRIEETLQRRANERAAELSGLPACMTRDDEEAEEAYIDRMHAVQNAAWRARGWTPFIEGE
jgi:hypothetical protein